MNLINYINECDDKSYKNLRNIFSNPPFNLTVKEDVDYPNLYMLCYNRNNYNPGSSIIDECRGIIIEKETNNIVCYTLPKIKKIDIRDVNNIEEYNKNIVWDNISVEESIDGTQIKLFYYNNEWVVSTTRKIDASKSKWGNRKNYKEMFEEAYNNCKSDVFNFDNLDKSLCYGFILQHPDNEIIIEYDQPSLVHIVTIDLQNNCKEIDLDIGCKKPKKYNFDSYLRLINICKIEEEFVSEGYIIKSIDQRYKIKSLNYMTYKELKGNYNNDLYHFFILRKDNLVQEYLYRFPKNLNKFNLFETYFRKMIKSMHVQYMNKYVFKNTTEVNKNYYPTVKNTHNRYLSGEIDKTKKEHLIEELLKLDTKLLYTIFQKYMNEFLSDVERDYIISEQ